MIYVEMGRVRNPTRYDLAQRGPGPPAPERQNGIVQNVNVGDIYA